MSDFERAGSVSDRRKRHGSKSHNRTFAEPEFPGFANVYESTGEAEPIDDDPAAAALNRR